MKKINYKLSGEIFWIGLIVGALIGFIWHITGLVILGISALQAMIFYRCPHCGYPLTDISMMHPSCCPRCGVDLYDE